MTSAWSRAGWFLAGAYVAVVAALTAVAFGPSADGFSVTEGLAAIATIPMIIVALPVIYVVGASAWNVFDTTDGSTSLGVTITFTAMMTIVAIANVALFYLVGTVVRRRRQARMKSPTTRPSSVPASSWRK